MPSKTEEYLALAQRTANGLTRYWESWTDYLTTASRLYKYPFADQLMIEKPREELTTTGSAPVPCAVTPTGLQTASRNFVPMSAEESTTTRKPWNSITRKKEI